MGVVFSLGATDLALLITLRFPDRTKTHPLPVRTLAMEPGLGRSLQDERCVLLLIVAPGRALDA